MSEDHPDAEGDFTRLIAVYRKIAAEAERLPVFSAWPLLRTTLEYLICYFGLILEFFILPYTLIALILRRFKINAPILAPGTKRLRYAALWLWRGELSPGVVVMRSLVRWQVRAHVERRLVALTQATYLNLALDDETRARLIERIDKERRWWHAPNLAQLSVRGTLPTLLAGAGAYVYNNVRLDQDTKDTLLALGIIFAVAIGMILIGVLLGSLPVKRGLFLGRPANRACYPGGVTGVGFYAEERALLERLGVRMREFPLDYFSATGSSLATLSLASGAQGLAALDAKLPAWAMTATSAIGGFYSQEELAVQWITFAVTSILWALVVVRRVVAKRL